MIDRATIPLDWLQDFRRSFVRSKIYIRFERWPWAWPKSRISSVVTPLRGTLARVTTNNGTPRREKHLHVFPPITKAHVAVRARPLQRYERHLERLEL